MSNRRNVTEQKVRDPVVNDNFEERLKGGDQEAFMSLFSEVTDELYRVSYIYVKNSDDARDAVQETAYRCFKEIRKLKHIEYFRTWAVKTAINCSLNILRKGKKTVLIDNEQFCSAETSPSPENAVVASVTLERLMNALNEREKSVVILRHLNGLSLEEVSKTLKIPLSTTKSILYRAMEKMRKEISE